MVEHCDGRLEQTALEDCAAIAALTAAEELLPSADQKEIDRVEQRAKDRHPVTAGRRPGDGGIGFGRLNGGGPHKRHIVDRRHVSHPSVHRTGGDPGKTPRPKAQYVANGAPASRAANVAPLAAGRGETLAIPGSG